MADPDTTASFLTNPLVALGIVTGSGGASFLGVWWLLIKPLQKRLAGNPPSERHSGEDRHSSAGDTHGAHEHPMIIDRLDRIDEKLEKISDKLTHCVTNDEFDGYTRHTTNAVHGLAEKVGHVTGVLEGWQQRNK